MSCTDEQLLHGICMVYSRRGPEPDARTAGASADHRPGTARQGAPGVRFLAGSAGVDAGGRGATMLSAPWGCVSSAYSLTLLSVPAVLEHAESLLSLGGRSAFSGQYACGTADDADESLALLRKCKHKALASRASSDVRFLVHSRSCSVSAYLCSNGVGFAIRTIASAQPPVALALVLVGVGDDFDDTFTCHPSSTPT